MNNYRSANYSSFSRCGQPSRNPYQRQSELKNDTPATSVKPSSDSIKSCGECNLECENLSSNNYDPLATLPLAMAYVPWQTWSKPLSSKEGLVNGTIFPDLILPFTGKCQSQCSCNNNALQRGGRR